MDSTIIVSVLIGTPSCLLSLWEALQDQKVEQIQDPFKLLLLHCISECVIFCMSPLKVESLFPTALWLSYMQIPLAFQGTYSGCLSSMCKTPKLGCSKWGLDP